MTDWIPDATAIETFRQNPEAFRLKHRLHCVPLGWDEATGSGAAFHAAQETWFQTESVEAALDTLREHWRDEPLFLTGLKRPRALFEALLQGYAARWPRSNDEFVVVRNEQRVVADIERAGVTFRWCGIIDRKIRFPDGTQYVMDTKTTSAYLSKDFGLKYQLGAQMPGYVALERALDQRCDGFFIDAVHVDTKYQRVKQERDFERFGPYLVPEWQLDRWARDVAHTLEHIRWLEETRGVDEPWPVYNNFPFMNPSKDPFLGVYQSPPELVARELVQFERVPWEPWK